MLKMKSEDGKNIITKKENLDNRDFILINISTNFSEDNKSVESYLTKEQAEELINNITLVMKQLSN